MLLTQYIDEDGNFIVYDRKSEQIMFKVKLEGDQINIETPYEVYHGPIELIKFKEN